MLTKRVSPQRLKEMVVEFVSHHQGSHPTRINISLGRHVDDELRLLVREGRLTRRKVKGVLDLNWTFEYYTPGREGGE